MKQSHKRQSFHHKLLALFLLSIILPIFILSAVLTTYFQQRMYESKEDYFSTSLYSVSTHLATYASDLKRLALVPYVYDDILNFFSAIDQGTYTISGSADYKTEQLRQNYITSMQRILITAREDILAVSFAPIASEDHLMVTTFKNADLIEFTDYDYPAESWFSDTLYASEPYYFTICQAPSYLNLTEGERVLTAVHTVKNVFSGRKFGVIRIDASDAILNDMFKNIELSQNSGFVIIDHNGEPIYQVGHVDSDVLPLLSGSGTSIKTATDTYDLYKSPITGMPWQLVFLSSRDDIAGEVSVIWGLAALLSIASITAAYLIFRSNSRKTAASLHSILDVMEEISQGNLDSLVPDTAFSETDSFSTQEFSQIAENLNEMVRRLKRYIDQSYKYQIQRQEAEYRALQSQINPHFLYNTLSCFLSMNRLGMKKELEEGIIQLTKIFRYTCSNAELTTVREEFDFCTQYCQLLKIRFDERLTFHIQLEPAAENIPIPRLIIQPLVENAIKHGMDTQGLDITIWISAAIQNHCLILKEYNNGVPIRTEDVYAEGKVGVRNVENRIRLIHPSANFSVELIDGITTFTISIPLEGEETYEHITRR